MLPATMSPPALKGVAIATTLLLAGCRGRGSEPAGGSLERDAAILTARTLGLAYLRSEQLAQAETAFSKIVALAPDQALGYANLGLVHLRLGRYDVAEREIRRAAARDTASDDIALTLAKVYELTGRTVEARHEVDRVLRRSPDDLRALYELAALDPASKETYLRRIVGRAPNNVAARLELVDALVPRGAADWAGAEVEALERQLPELPREANRFFQQALGLARAGRAAAAAVPAATLHRFMETTAPYQASLEQLRAAGGARPASPILTFNPFITPPAQAARTIAAAIRFSDVTPTVGLGGVPPLPDTAGDVALAIGDYDRDGAEDVFVGAHLFHNELAHATETTDRAGIRLRDQAGGAVAATFGDYDNDGRPDLYVASAGGTAPVLYHNRGDGTFEPDRRSAEFATLGTLAARAALFFDYDNDGFLDLVVVGAPTKAGARGVYLFRNDQTGRFVDHSAILPDDLRAARRVAAVDYDRDGDLDLIVVGEDGRPRLLLNDGGNANQYVKVELTALRTGSGKNNRFGIGATLELRAGKLYQSRVVTGPVTHFGLGQRLKADVLRVRWPNGVAQTVYYPGTDADILEQQILKGSCPFLYAWGGTAFRFVTDVMWRSALGMPLGIMAGGTDIASAPPHASREYMRIPGRALAPRNGRYVLQLTEELWETAYLDQAKLLAVDHPDSVDV